MRLLTIKEAAEQLNVPEGSLESAARRHGLLVKMGNAKRIAPDSLPELVAKCLVPPTKTASVTAGKVPTSLPRAPNIRTLQQAHSIAERLKRSAHRTSPNETGQTAPNAPKRPAGKRGKPE